MKILGKEERACLDKELGITCSELFNCEIKLSKSMSLLIKERITLNYSDHYFYFNTRNKHSRRK